MMKNTRPLFYLILSFLLLAAPEIIGATLHRFPIYASVSKQETGKIKITGVVKDENNVPLPYVSLGIINEEFGTVTNDNGNFTLLVPAGKEESTMRFSFIGYTSVELKVKDALQQFAKQKTLIIHLKPADKGLNEVKVDARRWVTSIKGGKVGPGATFHQAFMRTPGTTEEHLGREVGVLINNGKQAFLKKINFCINSNRYSDVKFRVNIYTVKDGRPEENILKENIYIEISEGETGWHELDLEPYNIYLKDDFVIALEWIDCYPKLKNVRFLSLTGGIGTHTVFQKKASQASWQKIPGAAVGLNVTLQHEK